MNRNTQDETNMLLCYAQGYGNNFQQHGVPYDHKKPNYQRMKRAIKALAFNQVNDYFGEFHTVGKRLKVTTRNTQIVVG